VRGGVPVSDVADGHRHAIVVDVFIPRAVSRAARSTARSHDEYRQLQVLKQPIVNTYTLTLLLVALVVLFAAIWFAFTFSKGFAVPIRLLGEGMREVAHGNWDYRAEAGGDEEFATLFTSFNQMTAELKTIHSELEERRRYIERVLSNITAGVLSLDDRGVVATINPAAGRMLGLSPENAHGREWRAALDRADLLPLRDLLLQLEGNPEGRIARQVRLACGPGALTAWVSAVALHDEEGRQQGSILFLEDVSHLLRVERMEAWREVARRIAHEIKNPLTPIQLSAQRLRKRLDADLGPERRAVLEECTATIIGQVEQLKKLVNEFSNFARLPAVELAADDLGAVVEEALALFREAHPEVDFRLVLDPALPLVELDREAVRRAVINLLDNAVSACQSQASPRVAVSVAHDEGMSVVRLEVADNGPGIAADVKSRVFEPYFSTKKDGTGLGLAIVSAIIAEHQGYLRLADADPHGARVVAEFPTRRRDRLRAVAR
jgi:two-component system nitrogen regulation sensor histidine kinase NtrY